MRSEYATKIYSAQFGAVDYKSRVSLTDPFVTDLYDTTGDEDLRILDELSDVERVCLYHNTTYLYIVYLLCVAYTDLTK